ncbi:hypothetical protein GCM10011349_24450 [Novosphingobium indicum]|jgi:hypothetical protein|uniref:Phage shock protein B n=1 Tax=Novosphingobium indicum TaxID=462949 RepID=A0ABQ2JQP2_9SPHN|nr:hypothetical protein [Novosphingobium indicum]GGN51667.1 hypothetical protein GCM10011349_24450 [Novosphingobium indicum]
MSFWTAVVVLFAIACFTWLRTQKYKALGKRGHDHTAREHELEREVEAMRKRVAVLERIATDEQRGKDLAHEIESLRD